MRSWYREIADLVLPVDCAGCGRVRSALCDGCREKLCGAGAIRRVWPDPVPSGLPPVYAAGAYEDEVRAVLLAHKERGALRLAEPLGEALAQSVQAAIRGVGGGEGEGEAPHPGPLLLIPVPSARLATAARGHDPARRVALRAARELRRAGVSARVLAVLRQRRLVADQAGLSAAERLENLSGALGAVSGSGRLLRDGPVVVVDDVLTTGASVVEAARALDAAGGRVCAAAVVAATPRAFGLVGAATSVRQVSPPPYSVPSAPEGVPRPRTGRARRSSGSRPPRGRRLGGANGTAVPSGTDADVPPRRADGP
ncbi:ComF family protein [Streptantibioticus ferralitis]|uniref:Phosphoribosyltransferase family protein n=1 Tax=Streptantibioticus ferralitis TaxID=236510 RepID=A0ABT5YUF4_9ACTN|nr:phosphoribosyltransferase family protein [Streptantibioticus ferralitis]MDF2255232.1 phosphoribosyltransferase family protein [Streptantibioticus ferralitis]